MNLYKNFTKLCTPAGLYLVLSTLALFFLIYQNITNKHTICVGNYSCSVHSVSFIFMLQFLYILFWTWILNLICKSGWNIISWILVLFPFILAFFIVVLGMSQN